MRCCMMLLSLSMTHLMPKPDEDLQWCRCLAGPNLQKADQLAWDSLGSSLNEILRGWCASVPLTLDLATGIIKWWKQMQNAHAMHIVSGSAWRLWSICPGVGSTPGHITPSRTTLKPQSSQVTGQAKRFGHLQSRVHLLLLPTTQFTPPCPG